MRRPQHRPTQISDVAGPGMCEQDPPFWFINSDAGTLRGDPSAPGALPPPPALRRLPLRWAHNRQRAIIDTKRLEGHWSQTWGGGWQTMSHVQGRGTRDHRAHVAWPEAPPLPTTKTRSGPQMVRMSSGERPMGAAKGKQSDTEALCQTPPHRLPKGRPNRRQSPGADWSFSPHSAPRADKKQDLRVGVQSGEKGAPRIHGELDLIL